jgi:hypothetical protein
MAGMEDIRGRSVLRSSSTMLRCRCVPSRQLLEFRSDSQQEVYVAIVLGTPALGIIKMSLLIQFYILFNMRRYIRVSVWVAGVGLGVFYTTVTLVAFALTSPRNGESLLETAATWRTRKFADFAIPIGTIGMATDWFLFFLPMPAVWSLHLSLSKKIGVTLVFATGLL